MQGWVLQPGNFLLHSYLHVTKRPSQGRITGAGYSLMGKALQGLITVSDSNTCFLLIKRSCAFSAFETISA